MLEFISVQRMGAVVLFGVLALAGCAVTPKELSHDQLMQLASENLDVVSADQEPLNGHIDLYDAMARALKYNLDYRVEALQTAVRMKELRLTHFSGLPSVVAGTNYNGRNNFSGGVSQSLLDGQQSLEPSTSQERNYTVSDLAFSWNILDFGLSYVRARQAADQVLIANEARRKVANRIIEDVRSAYWRAVSSDRLIAKFRALRERIRYALTNSSTLATDGETSPVTALTYERELHEIKKRLEELERQLTVAKSQLAALMNIKPGRSFRLADYGRSRHLPKFEFDGSGMIYTALQSRSELREVEYRRRVNAHEADAALLEMLPGIQVVAGLNNNSNDFLFNNNYVSWGAKASWNLIKAFELPAKNAVIDANDELLYTRSLALTMAIMTQVHVSRVRYELYRREYGSASDLLRVQRRLLGEIRVEEQAGRVSEQNAVREEMNTLVAEVERDIAYAELQTSFANLFASMGYSIDPEIYSEDVSVGELASELRHVWSERGDANARRKVARR